MGKKVAKVMLGAVIGSVVLGLASYYIVDATTRSPGAAAGGMGGLDGLESFLAGAGGCLIGLVGGAFLAYWLDRRNNG